MMMTLITALDPFILPPPHEMKLYIHCVCIY